MFDGNFYTRTAGLSSFIFIRGSKIASENTFIEDSITCYTSTQFVLNTVKSPKIPFLSLVARTT